MTRFPSRKELDRVLGELSGVPGTRIIPKDASPVDRVKHDICAEFVKLMLKCDLTQRGLANRIGIAESLVSKIVRYQFDEFTIDRLYQYLHQLDPSLKIKVTRKRKRPEAA